jgi:broad specificity phosphatase PhoE
MQAASMRRSLGRSVTSRSMSKIHSTPRRILRACALLPCLLGSSSAFTGTSTISSFQMARSFSTTTTSTTATNAASTSNDDDAHKKNPNLLADVTSLQNSYVCLRHGQSLANVAGRIASNPALACTSSGLSELGNQQAIQAGRDVVEHYQQKQQSAATAYNGLLILSSDLLRADQTANHVLQAALAAGIPVHTGKVVTEIRLRERWFGDWDDTSDANYEQVWKDDLLDPSHCLSQVESVDSVMERATQCIVDWDHTSSDSSSSAGGAKVQNHCVVCVAHGDVLQILQTAFQKLHGSQHRSLEHLETATIRPVLLASSAVAKSPSSSS